MGVIDFTKPAFVKILESTDKFKAIEELAQVFNGTSVCDNVADLVRALREREEIMSTGIGFGIAIPHAKISTINEMAFAVGISRGGIDFDSMDGEPVHLVILVAAGERQHKEYLRLLSNIMSILKKDNVKDSIIQSSTPDQVIEIFRANG